MSSTATRPDTSYLLRKLHSFTGVLPVGAFLAEHFWSNSSALVSAEKYNATSQELQTIPFRLIVEWGGIFSADALSRRLRHLHLAARQIKRIGISVGRELALRDAEIYGPDRVCVYWLAPLHGALAHAWQVDVCKRGGRHAESVVPGLFCRWRACFVVPSRCGPLQFPMQVGAGGHCQGAASGGALWRTCWSCVQCRRD